MKWEAIGELCESMTWPCLDFNGVTLAAVIRYGSHPPENMLGAWSRIVALGIVRSD